MKTFIILNHKLNQEQLSELGSEIVVLNEDEKKIWGQIPSEGNKFSVYLHIKPILDKLDGFDQVVCQGEFTAYTIVVDECRKLNIPVFVACAKRETVETIEKDGSTKKVAVFNHVQFREV